MKKADNFDAGKWLIENRLNEQPLDPRFTHYSVDETMLQNIKSALKNINQQALTQDTANMVLQNNISVNEDGDVVIKFFSKPRK
jgi:hypothetical protein